MKRIHLSALEPKIGVGCLYDYFNGKIIPNGISIAGEDVIIEHNNPLKARCSFPVDPSERLKRYMLGISSHIKDSLEKEFLKQVWFAKYLNASSVEDAKGDSAQVTVFLRIEQRTEALSQHHIESNLDEYRTLSYGQAKHLVEKVTYGAEVILWFHKKIDVNYETKESVTSQMRSLARNLINDAMHLENNAQSKIDLPVGVSCSVFSNFSPALGGFVGVFLLPNCYRWLRRNIHADKDFHRQRKWWPIQITLRNISEQIKKRMSTADGTENETTTESFMGNVLVESAFSQILEEGAVIYASREQQSGQTETEICEKENGKQRVHNVDRPPKNTKDVGCQTEINKPEKIKKNRSSTLLDKEGMISRFALDVWKNIRLMQRGCPSIHFLNASKNITAKDFKWFHYGQPAENDSFKASSTSHKVIVLMGTSGCGKSTLINGMVNYIFGVRWEDPFRFKITDDDDDFSEHKTRGRTSSVVAYTIHRKPEMVIPYSITIIDTPGYGDTLGIDRDKEITLTIHRLLTKQTNVIDRIHAVYFVAASGKFRLTASQRYVIDSIPILFGNGIKANTRLLVTFANSNDPPIVEACRAANFFLPNETSEIQFTKFNNSVLYAINEQQKGGGDISSSQIIWDRNEENFLNTFYTLQDMEGCHLQSPDETVRRTKLLGHYLRSLEDKMEVCFVNIENTELFRRKMMEYNDGVNPGNNFLVEKTELITENVICDDGYVAYNCLNCNFTCESRVKRFVKRICMYDRCKCGSHFHAFQDFELKNVPIPIQTTILNFKKEFKVRFGSSLTTRQLLDKCLDELELERAKVFSLLDQMNFYTQTFCPATLKFSELHSTEYLNLISRNVEKRKEFGYLVRLETLAKLKNSYAITKDKINDNEEANRHLSSFHMKNNLPVENFTSHRESPLSSAVQNNLVTSTPFSNTIPEVVNQHSEISEIGNNSNSSQVTDKQTSNPNEFLSLELPQSRRPPIVRLRSPPCEENDYRIYESISSYEHSDSHSTTGLLTPSSIESDDDQSVFEL